MAETAEERAERRKIDWEFEGTNYRVTPEVHQVIVAPYRGQTNLGKKQKEADTDRILQTLQLTDEDAEDCLPTWEEDDASGDDSDDNSEDGEDEGPPGAFDVPAGFTVLTAPAALLAGQDLHGVFVAMLWSTGWHVGRVKKFAPTRRRHNYDILWNDGLRGSYLSLETYYVVPQANQAVPQGSWMYLKKSNAVQEDT